MYIITSKDEQIKVNEGCREEQNKKKERIQIPNKIMSPLPQKK